MIFIDVRATLVSPATKARELFGCNRVGTQGLDAYLIYNDRSELTPKDHAKRRNVLTLDDVS